LLRHWQRLGERRARPHEGEDQMPRSGAGNTPL
jgi:hypothetical protein